LASVRRAAIVVLALTVAAAAATAPAGALPPLLTGVVDPYAVTGDSSEAAFAAISGAGARFVRLFVDWSHIAPVTPPAGFDASDPNDPAYQWHDLDSQVKQAVAAGLQPILDITGTPTWASPLKIGAVGYPDSINLAAFASAIATRYSGATPGIPRVRDWQLWNEPNLTVTLLPQFKGGRPVSPLIYRGMLDAFANAIHGVDSSNIVIAGALSPFTVDNTSLKSVGPLRFMRQLLCMSAGNHPHPTCKKSVPFDVWAHHPYTSGGPFHHADNPDDVSLGDLPKMRALLTAARRAGHIVAPHGLGFWVTEFSWDTNPPDPHAVPIALQARWTAEALHQMWLSGVTLVVWWLLQDQPYPQSSFQSGLYFGRAPLVEARPKPTLTAFHFPFVAYLRPSGVYVWGRTPDSKPSTVVIEKADARGGPWRRVATVVAGGNGLFSQNLPLKATASAFLRARAVGSVTLPFSLTQPPDRPYHAFG
jgi:hypothetical protein